MAQAPAEFRDGIDAERRHANGRFCRYVHTVDASTLVSVPVQVYGVTTDACSGFVRPKATESFAG
jgi:hypothetical protein